jgi:pimeloyl-ACP methyl ester carboxylesterase
VAATVCVKRLARFSHLILFDKRGTGLSDPVTRMPTLEQRMDDVRAVMDTVGSKRAVLLGVSEGGRSAASSRPRIRAAPKRW